MNEPTPDPLESSSAKIDDAELVSGTVGESVVADEDTSNEPLGGNAFENDTAHQSPSTLPDQVEGRLHIATVWLPCLELVASAVIPVLIASIFLPIMSVAILVSCFAILPTAVFHLVQFISLRYQLTNRELVIMSGIVFHRERRIPLDRIQETSIHQGIVHRLLALAKLEITTAGSDAQEANLNVLSREAARTIKAKIDGDPSVQAPTREVVSTEEQADYLCQLEVRDLFKGGLTSRLVASVGAVIAAIAYFKFFVGVGDAWWGRAEQNLNGRIGPKFPGEASVDQFFERLETMIPDLGPLNIVIDFFLSDTLPRSILLVLFGLAGSVIAYVVRYHGFRLARRGDLLSTSYGLLTLRSGSFSRDRIQALKLEESLLRRYFGLASIRADSAGDRTEIDETKKRDVLVPVATLAVAQEITQQAMPGLKTLDPEWHRISPKAVMRGTKKGWLLVLAAMLQTFGVFGWYCLALLPAVPFVYLLNYQWFRHTGYWVEADYFLSRQGWLNRETVCLPINNIQNISVTQNFFDRRRDLATLSIDTAGQSNTGGGPIIRNLPVNEASRIQASLAKRVAELEFRSS